MYLRWNMFKDYCVKNNIHLLRDDFLYIEKLLRDVPSNLHRTLLYDYCQEWIKVMGQNSKSPQSQNLGRYAANKLLSRLVKK